MYHPPITGRHHWLYEATNTEDVGATGAAGVNSEVRSTAPMNPLGIDAHTSLIKRIRKIFIIT